MTLNEIANYACTKTGRTDSLSLSEAKSYVAARYRIVWQAALWRDALISRSATVAAGARTVTLWRDIERVVAVRWGTGTPILPQEEISTIIADPTAFEATGDPVRWTELRAAATASDPSSRQIRVYSDSPDDAASVTIKGELSGAFRSERMTLNGNTAVTSAFAYDLITGFSKPATAGKVHVLDGLTQTEILDLDPEETQRRYPRIHLYSAPDEADTLLVVCKLACPLLENDEDSPLIRGIDGVLLAFAEGDILERQRQYAKAAQKFTEAGSLLQTAMDEERAQGSRDVRIVPIVYASYEEKP